MSNPLDADFPKRQEDDKVVQEAYGKSGEESYVRFTPLLCMAEYMAKIKSRKAAMQDIGNPHLNDEQQIMKEWEAELELKQRYSGSTTEDNPNTPSIDNNAPGKSVLE